MVGFHLLVVPIRSKEAQEGQAVPMGITVIGKGQGHGNVYSELEGKG